MKGTSPKEEKNLAAQTEEKKEAAKTTPHLRHRLTS